MQTSSHVRASSRQPAGHSSQRASNASGTHRATAPARDEHRLRASQSVSVAHSAPQEGGASQSTRQVASNWHTGRMAPHREHSSGTHRGSPPTLPQRAPGQQSVSEEHTAVQHPAGAHSAVQVASSTTQPRPPQSSHVSGMQSPAVEQTVAAQQSALVAHGLPQQSGGAHRTAEQSSRETRGVAS